MRRAGALETGADPIARAIAEVAAVTPLAGELERVERRLGELLRSSISHIPRIDGPRGARVRPLVTLLAAQAAGYRDEHRITVAAVGELLHLQSLLHEDVCDRGEFRRGRPVARLGHGNGLSVLLGDFCVARALQAIAEIGDVPALRCMTDVIVRQSEGEVVQLHGSGACDLDREQHASVVGSRTAALLGWCGAVGLLLAPPAATALGTYGDALGFALQTADEVRDCALDLPRADEPPGQALRDGKVTLPVIVACERSPGLRGQLLELLRDGAPIDEARLHAVLERVADSGGLDEARAVAASHAAAAQAALAALPPSPARAALAALAFAVVGRAQ